MSWEIDYRRRHGDQWGIRSSGRWDIRPVANDSLRPRATTVPASARATPAIEPTFVQLRDTWLREASHLSSMSARAMHPAYQRIIGLGEAALPLILRELDQRPAQWTWALRSISGEDPVAPEDRGSLRKEREAWLAWGSRSGLL
jgi:hypothetical protein